MRIGIDCRAISDGMSGGAGMSRYVYGLARELVANPRGHEYVLFFNHPSPIAKEFVDLKARVVTLNKSASAKSRIPLMKNHWRFSRKLKREKLDLFHATAQPLPLFYKGPSVVTIHDLAIYRLPQYFPDGQWFSTKFLVPRSLKRAKRIIAVSEATKRDCEAQFKIPSDKIAVIGEGVRWQDEVLDGEMIGALKQRLRSRQSLTWPEPQQYYLAIGTIEPRKNIATLLRAYRDFSDLHDRQIVPALVIAGAPGWKYEEILAEIEVTQRAGYRVLYLGYISEREKQLLITDALSLVMVSHYEGFGLPVLEAMHAGVPVIVSRMGNLAELAGEAGLSVDPDDKEGIALHLNQLWQDPELRRKLAGVGPKRAAPYTWEKAADETVAVYEEAAGQKRDT